MSNEPEAIQNEETIDSSKVQSMRPIVSFSGSGGINVAVWKNKAENGSEHYSVRIERNFKDGNGNFQSTAYLRAGDLLRTQSLLIQADTWIEQDKAKNRSANATSAGRA